MNYCRVRFAVVKLRKLPMKFNVRSVLRVMLRCQRNANAMLQNKGFPIRSRYDHPAE